MDETSTTEAPNQAPEQQQQQQHHHHQQRLQHPRRRAANKSVSLRHPHESRPTKSPSEDESPSQPDLATTNLSNPPNYHKDSSGESSNAEKWFEKSNNKVATTSASFADDEPPFFLRNSSSDDTPPEVARERVEQAQAEIPEFRVLSPDSEGSASEDFRSVIDDLTIENKKLKRRLRRYEKSQSSHLLDDKLFEIRVHGLSTEKKKELEDLLKDFVTNLEDSPKSYTSDPSHQPSSLQNAHQASSSKSNTSRFVDSGYASISASGRYGSSAAQSLPEVLAAQKDVRRALMSKQQQQDIQSYLHDIPLGLLPKASSPMTDRTKRKVVVRRLEQIFAGKNPASRGPQQPIQQQRVAQSAARADRRAIEATGKRASEEGSREAPIMPEDTETEAEAEARQSSYAYVTMDIPMLQPEVEDNTSLEQRPTRPLDLDPFRAQVPSENIRYMRHLGFSPSDAGSTEVLMDGHGWIYLNVLANMAQLHTINVTQEFVRKSISTYSKKLQLSPDGRKVRWKGGSEITRLSSQNSPDDASPANASSGKASGSISKTTTGSSEVSSDGPQATGDRERLNYKHKLAYSPLFHKVESEADDVAAEEAMTNWTSNITGNTSGITSPGTRAKRLRPKKGEEGPIIFYNRVGFYTDLTGDPSSGLPFAKRSNYHRLPAEPIGVEQLAAAIESHRLRESQKGPLSKSETTFNPTPRSVQNLVGKDLGLNINSDKVASLQSSSDNSPDPIEFEASGVGGVLPTDNFSISVQSKQNNLGLKEDGEQERFRSYPIHIRNALRETDTSSSNSMSTKRAHPTFQREIITSRLKDLPASALPPASYYPFSSPDEEEEDDEESYGFDSASDDAESVEGRDGHERLPTEASQKIDWRAAMVLDQSSIDDGSEDDDDDDDNDDKDEEENEGNSSSVDMLAHARQADPETVHNREREFDSNMAERLAEEIPAGSSAATADGGSGFNTPSMKTTVEGQQGPSMPPRRAYSLKRARRSDDSMMLHGARATKSPKLEESE